jgi:putative NIF3 family GTP cyclohydrolase 1 type 2
MASLQEIVAFLDAELRIAEIPDYSGAVNGLQLGSGGAVTKVAAAVDASLPVVEAAVAAGADLLLVHHGMFWQGAQPLTGAFYRKIKAAMDGGLAIYSAHLPLDVHPSLGNNALLMQTMGFSVAGTFFEWKGIRLGLTAEVDLSRDELRTKLSAAVGGGVHLCPGGPEQVRKIGLVTGGAGAEVAMAAAAGIDTFFTPATTPPRLLASRRWLPAWSMTSACRGNSWIIPAGCDAKKCHEPFLSRADRLARARPGGSIRIPGIDADRGCRRRWDVGRQTSHP